MLNEAGGLYAVLSFKLENAEILNISVYRFRCLYEILLGMMKTLSDNPAEFLKMSLDSKIPYKKRSIAAC